VIDLLRPHKVIQHALSFELGYELDIYCMVNKSLTGHHLHAVNKNSQIWYN